MEKHVTWVSCVQFDGLKDTCSLGCWSHIFLLGDCCNLQKQAPPSYNRRVNWADIQLPPQYKVSHWCPWLGAEIRWLYTRSNLMDLIHLLWKWCYTSEFSHCFNTFISTCCRYIGLVQSFYKQVKFVVYKISWLADLATPVVTRGNGKWVLVSD